MAAFAAGAGGAGWDDAMVGLSADALAAGLADVLAAGLADVLSPALAGWAASASAGVSLALQGLSSTTMLASIP